MLAELLDISIFSSGVSSYILFGGVVSIFKVTLEGKCKYSYVLARSTERALALSVSELSTDILWTAILLFGKACLSLPPPNMSTQALTHSHPSGTTVLSFSSRIIIVIDNDSGTSPPGLLR